MSRCDTCKARNQCLAAVEPGSLMCAMNLLKSGHTHGEERSYSQEGVCCKYCGQPLKVIGPKRFCNNVYCINRYISV